MNIFTYIKETKNELKEVKFPSIAQTITYTVLVVVVSALVAAVLGGVDFGLKNALTSILAR